MNVICAVLLVVYSSLIRTKSLDCPSSPPSDWKESYCPEDIDRIEYQIPLDHTVLSGSTVKQIDEFIQYIRDNLESADFKLRQDKTRKYYRVVEELEIAKKANVEGTKTDIAAPRVSAIKYRKSFGDFKMKDSEYKYKNDLTWENAMTTPGKDLDWKAVAPLKAYSKIYKTKLEANIMVDPCDSDLSNHPPTYGETGTGFAAKIAFDDSGDYGTNDANGLTMIDTSKWRSLSNRDDFYCDSTGIGDCVCMDVQRYFQKYCTYFSDDPSEQQYHQEYKFTEGYDYIVDVDFYWYKNGDANALPKPEHTAKGKFTFQTRYSSLENKVNDIVNDASTEVSVKLYKSKCKEVATNWKPLTAFAEQLVDDLVSVSAKLKWIDHRMCAQSSQCGWNGKGKPMQQKCAKQTTEADCNNSAKSCVWGSGPTIAVNAENILVGNGNEKLVIGNNSGDSKYGFYGSSALFALVLFVGIYGFYLKCHHKIVKSEDLGTYTPLLRVIKM